MTIYTAFNERENLTSISDINDVSSTDSSSVALSGINRAGIRFEKRASARFNFEPLSEGWAHVRIRSRSSSRDAITDACFSIDRGSTGESIAKITQQSGNTNLYANVPNGSTGDILLAPDGTYNFDINFKIAEEGFVRYFVDGNFEYEFTGDTRFSDGSQNVFQGYMRNTGNSSSGFNSYVDYFSQIMIADTSTIGAKVYTLPVSEGSLNEWGGNVSDVSGTSFSDSDSIFANQIDETVFFNKDELPVIDDLESIAAVIVSTRARFTDNSSVTALDGVTSNGTQGEFGNEQSVTTSYEGYQSIANLNPLTNEDWERSEVNSQEVGLIAKE